MVLADLVHGEVDWADVLFLVAAIIFFIVFVIRLQARSIDGMLIAAGFVILSVAWLLL
jgi:hypothetical protein